MKRTVAFLDVLGFKALVEAVEHSELLARYSTLQNVARRASTIPIFPDDHRRYDSDAYYADHEVTRVRTAHVVMASDSIVVFPDGDDHNGTRTVLATVRALLAGGLKAGLPLRGGVARGELDLLEDSDDSGSTFLGRFDGLVGRGLVDAYVLESECAWSGAIVDQGVADHLHDTVVARSAGGDITAWHAALTALLIAPTRAPIKVQRDGAERIEPQPRWAVAWPHAVGEGAAVRELSQKEVAAAFASAGAPFGPREQAKRNATVDFMKEIQAGAESTELMAAPTLPEGPIAPNR